MKLKKMIACILSLCMLATMMPATVMAAEPEPVTVSNVTDLQAAINAAVDGTVIKFTTDITGDVLITQKDGVDLTIDGDGNTFSGSMLVFGQGRHTGTETLAIENINFVADTDTANCIWSPKVSEITGKNFVVDSGMNYNYSHNVTVDNCTFAKASGNNSDSVVAVRLSTGGGNGYNWKINGCTVNAGMHSLLQASSVATLTVSNCKVYAGEGINLNNSNNIEVTGCTFDVDGYAVRTGETAAGTSEVKMTLTDNKITSDGTAVILRASAPNVELDMSGNAVEAETHIDATGITETENVEINADDNYWGEGKTAPTTSNNLNAVVTVGSYYENEERTELKYAEGVVAEVDGEYFSSLADAVAAAEDGDTVTLLSDAEGGGIVVPKNFGKLTIDLGGNTYKIVGPAVGSAGTVTLGFQLHKGNEITIVNGKITEDTKDSDGAGKVVKRLIQNYSDLTLDDVVVDGSNLDDENSATRSVLSVCNGNVTITGETEIIGPATGYAMDVYDYKPSYEGADVTFESFTGKVVGNIQVGGEGTEEPYDAKLTIDSNSTGTFDSEIVMQENAEFKEGEDAVTVAGGYYTSPVDPAMLADGLNYEVNDDGVYSYYATEEEAIAAAQDAGAGATVSKIVDGEVQGTPIYTTPTTPDPTPSTTKKSTKKYAVSIDDDEIENGSIKLSSSKAKKGATVTITVTPDAGYELDKLVVLDDDGDKVELTDKGNGKFTFKMPRGGVEVEASFVEIEGVKVDDEIVIVLTIDETLMLIDGEYVVNDVAPIIRGERTVLPIRVIAEALGASVSWNEAEQTVTIVKGEMTIVVYIGQAFALVNGEPVALDQPAFIENGRTYLPLRFIMENLGAEVTWDALTQKVTIVG